MKEIRQTITIEIVPVPKGRPRCRCIPIGAGKARAQIYTPKDTEKFEQEIAAAVRACWPYGRLHGAVEVNVDVFKKRPGSRPRPKHGGPSLQEWKSGVALPATTKPDKDNYEKAILDGIARADVWFDDAQVWSGRTRKWYAPKGEDPMIRITISGRTE